MKQLIYRNPLAVLWMMETYGVKFEYQYNDDFVEIQQIRCAQNKFAYRNDIFAEILITGIRCLQTRNFWQAFEHGEAIVHPDSLPLFEPQNGDLIEIREPSKLFPGKFAHEIIKSCGFLNRDEKLLRIIERNGKHFMWPDEIREDGDD